MRDRHLQILVLLGACWSAAGHAEAFRPQAAPLDWSAILLDQLATAPAHSVAPGPRAPAAARVQEQPAGESEATKPLLYRGISRFFNVREAYSNLPRGELELELEAVWTTQRHERDSVAVVPQFYYGITNDLHVELEVETPLGEGGRGAGETELTVFQTFWHEHELRPAVGGYASLRMPTGYRSSGVDGTFGAIATKTLLPRLRAHLEGWVMTANGAAGDEERAQRRPFQWGAGPGFDYRVNDDLVAVVNYLNRVSEERGQHNTNVLELGAVWKVAQRGDDRMYLKFALDVGLDGQRETPNLGAKIAWEIDLK